MAHYQPTLAGLQKAQNFFAEQGFPLPIFSMDIFRDGKEDFLKGWKPGTGRTLPVSEAVKQYGPHKKVNNVRLSSEDGRQWITFRHPYYADYATSCAAVDMWEGDTQFVCVVEIPSEKVDPHFARFMSEKKDEFLVITQWVPPMLTSKSTSKLIRVLAILLGR